MFERAYTVSSTGEFQSRLLDNMLRLEEETGQHEFAVPVAILLVLDEPNGGNAVGKEIVNRFPYLDSESRNVIDFFFPGWRRGADARGLVFDLAQFQAFRETLRKRGVSSFGGYADLLMFDAWLRGGRVLLDFEHAIHIDLVESLSSGAPAVGKQLQDLIDAATSVCASWAPGDPVVVRISDRLGLATAGKSLLDSVLHKWGAVIGATRLVHLRTQRLAPAVDLAEF
jgi:hypothetical protein